VNDVPVSGASSGTPVRVSDFRSDTVTRPSPAMRAAIAAAEVGDDVLDGDPTVRRLEQRAAELLGKAGALFVPSGTMANQCALGSWLRPGDELVIERSAHIVCWEAGAPAALHGAQPLTVHAPDGRIDPAELRAVVRMRSTHCPQTRLLCVEQTFMGSGEAAGGYVVPLEHLRVLSDSARELGLAVHMDGARLFNAVVASGIEARDFAACADSVSVCLSKGLGAPVGSLIAGDEEFLARARVVRKRLGGWMRQSGLLAAAGLFALEHNVERLAEDHALARALASALDGRAGIACPPDEVQTNIVMARVDPARRSPEALAAALAERGVRVLAQNATTLRFVTHMDVGPADVVRLSAALDAIL
jgi:threonine aldolase